MYVRPLPRPFRLADCPIALCSSDSTTNTLQHGDTPTPQHSGGPCGLLLFLLLRCLHLLCWYCCSLVPRCCCIRACCSLFLPVTCVCRLVAALVAAITADQHQIQLFQFHVLRVDTTATSIFPLVKLRVTLRSELAYCDKEVLLDCSSSFLDTMSSSAPSDETLPPFHILMASSSPAQEILVRDPRLRNDYLARRFRCLSDGEAEKDVWSAASSVERALVDCCDLGVDNDEEYSTSGCLTKGKEGLFVRLLALHCDTAATRALALAILQRTIEQDELDQQEDDDDDDDDDDESDDGESEEDGDDVGDDNNKRQPIKSEKESESASQREAVKTETSEKVSDVEDKKDKDKDQEDRMSSFLAAGGLTILKEWLIDAMTPVKTVIIKSPQSSAGTKQKINSPRVIQEVSSPTGPLLLPLLSVLEHMPFDKNLVKSSKINKQIRNLKKQLDEATASHKGKKGQDQWRDPVAGGLVVAEVQTAVESLMQRWEERNKTSTLETSDPFETLREKMAERLAVLKKFEAGDVSKPEWLERFEERERIAKEEEELSKLTTEQRAARERQQEREKLLEHAQKRQKEAKAKRDQLLKSREESQKRKADGQGGEGDRKRTRRLRWKDGLNNSDNLKQRSLLEQVYVYPKESAYDDYEEEDLNEGQTEVSILGNNEVVRVKQEPEEDGDSSGEYSA